jgi:hypothetical protein
MEHAKGLFFFFFETKGVEAIKRLSLGERTKIIG